MVGLRTSVAVRMILYLDGSAPFLEHDPHGLGLVGCPESSSLLGFFRMLAPVPGYHSRQSLWGSWQSPERDQHTAHQWHI